MILALADPRPQIIMLEKGQYTISLGGGFNVVRTGNFKIKIVGDTVELDIKEHKYKVNSLYKWNRTTRFASFFVPSTGRFIIHIKNPQSLVFRHSRLLFSRLFDDPLPLDHISILIQKS